MSSCDARNFIGFMVSPRNHTLLSALKYYDFWLFITVNLLDAAVQLHLWLNNDECEISHGQHFGTLVVLAMR